MAVSINGKQIQWGITTEAKSAADALIEGIVESFKVTPGGNTEEIPDEDGDIVTRVDHGKTDMLEMTTRVTATTPDLPEKGDEVTGLATYDGVDLSTGRSFVEDSSIEYSGTASTKVSISVKHYPEMEANSV